MSPTASEVELTPIRHRKTRQPIGYGRFARAADAIRFAIEELSPELLMAAQLKVADEDSAATQFAGCTRASNIRWPDALQPGEQNEPPHSVPQRLVDAQPDDKNADK